MRTDSTAACDGSSVVNLICYDPRTPVELASFSAVYHQDEKTPVVMLKWTTASESRNLGFAVEKSYHADAEWRKIGFVTGNGTTQLQYTYTFVDDNVLDNDSYWYRLVQIDQDGTTTTSQSIKVSVRVPREFKLDPLYPNPFNAAVTVPFYLPIETNVSITIYDIKGYPVKVLVDERRHAGYHTIRWHAKNHGGLDVASGIYFIQLSAEGQDKMQRAILIR